jgi:hypothetical protein
LAPALSAETTAERRERVKEEKSREAEARKRETGEKAGRAKAAAERAKPKVITLDEHGLSFRTAPHWHASSSGSGASDVVQAVAYLDPKATDGGKIADTLFVSVRPLAEGQTRDDVLQAQQKRMNCCGPHYTFTPDADRTLGGDPARVLVMAGNEEATKSIKGGLVGTTHNGKAYVFAHRGTVATYDAMRPQVNAMLDSVKWLDEKGREAK